MKTWKEAQREYLLGLIIEFSGDVDAMASGSGLGRATIYRYVKRFNLQNDLALERQMRRGKPKNVEHQ